MTTKPTDDNDDLTEVTWMHTPRVDLVQKAANGHDFILAKSAANDPDPDPSLFTEQAVLDLAKTAQEGNVTDTTTEPITKDALDPENLLEAESVTESGDADDVESAAWEATDAARAQQAIELAVALKRLVEAAQAREAQEALLGDDPDDNENVWDLGDVADQIDCILGVLAPFAVNEQAEADMRDADVDTSLVLKSGRTLSGANEQHIRQASALLESVLSTLPAPVEDVAKSEPEEAAVTTSTEPETIVKADGDMIPVYDANGKLVGTAKATAVVQFASAPAAADATDQGAGTTDPTDDAPAAAAADPVSAPETTTDSTPGVAADGTVIPGTQTVQSPAPVAPAANTDDDDTTVKKSLEDIVKSTLGELLAPLAAKVAETGDAVELVKSLQERVDAMGRTPDDRRSPLLNGARGAAVPIVNGAEDPTGVLEKAVAEASTPVERHAAQQRLAYGAIKDRFSN